MDHSREEYLEQEICEYLAANGWHYSTDDTGYDKDRALFPEDLFAWLEETQTDELAKVVKQDAPDVTKQRTGVLDALVSRLDTQMQQGGGTLNVLRRGVKHINASFYLMQAKPPTTFNTKTNADYAANRVRVMRQVHYSKSAPNDAIDLVLFVNGLPVATVELKTEFKQSVRSARQQYEDDRDPAGHPLLAFGGRALVHFAVSDAEVWMATKLAGKSTFFLPFNIGNDKGAGNPPNPDGAATSYLWERVWQKDAWLNILSSFMHVKTEESTDPISGRTSKRTWLMFPRFHQWEAVTKTLDAAAIEGPGHHYLVEHSAGSGKTNTIAWTAHRLARLHNLANEKVFDKVLVVTDRTVLDRQLQDAVRQIDNQADLVATIDDRYVRDNGGSKSAALAVALASTKLVVVVTIQTFPFAIDAIRANPDLRGRNYAIVADEAHSGQSGATAGDVRRALSAGATEVADGDDIDIEDLIAAEMTERADVENISFFAYTATPKPKTLELFGRPDPDGKPRAFHLYSMKQAIEEGFILDVLRGFHTYDTAFELAQKVVNAPVFDGDLVDKSAATRGLMRWVRLHPSNIAQRVQIIVEHFRSNVAHLLEGHAKAMVVTEGRHAAVRYKLEIDKYIASQGYPIKTLVAFSGSLDEPEYGIENATEANMNPSAGPDLAEAFKRPEYRVMLVADKYQTGFDQPLLCAMYVAKTLHGIEAVQTLSRLNRTYRAPDGEVKERTFILDFTNDPEDIRRSFEPYFEEARLEEVTDPNLVHQLVAKLDIADIYTNDEIERFAVAWYGQEGNMALSAAVAPAKDRFVRRYRAAMEFEKLSELEALDTFRADAASYVRLYDFLSQIVDYGDTRLEKLAIYLRQLVRVISGERADEPVDLSDVVITRIAHIDRGRSDIRLSGGELLRPMSAVGTHTNRDDPDLVALREVIERINALFGGEFDSEQIEAAAKLIAGGLSSDDIILQQIKNNTPEQFVESGAVDEAIEEVALDQGAEMGRLFEAFIIGPKAAEARRVLKQFIYLVGGRRLDETLSPHE